MGRKAQSDSRSMALGRPEPQARRRAFLAWGGELPCPLLLGSSKGANDEALGGNQPMLKPPDAAGLLLCIGNNSRRSAGYLRLDIRTGNKNHEGALLRSGGLLTPLQASWARAQSVTCAQRSPLMNNNSDSHNLVDGHKRYVVFCQRQDGITASRN